jgi:2-polyprenyl-6-hydroxyphenyl methylase/3-demethylubiquinone-9 3-methyltransferase
MSPPDSGVLPAEVAKFDALAATWWDKRGPMRPLHAMNPARIAWIDARLRAHNLAGADLLDVGCGAGIAAESLAQAGYSVLGIDAASAPIEAAIAHAPPGLSLTYRTTTIDALSATGATFSAITALEVIEHVPDPAAFIAGLARLLRPGGALVLSTLNRTPLSFLTAKLGAEYLLRLLPTGTHDWARFVTPAELAAHLRAAGLRLTETTGLRPDAHGTWQPVRSLSVNYLACALAEQ